MNKKAISPVIASILMMVVVVAIIIAMYGFSTGFLGGASSSVVEKGLGLTSSTSSGSIDAVNINQNEVYVRLLNDVGSSIDAVYIDSNLVACSGSGLTLTPETTELITLSVSNCAGLSSGIGSNQVIRVTGTNNFSATTTSGT